MSDDPFSDILAFVNAETVVSGGFTAGGPWALRFPAPDKLKYFAVVKGGCWLQLAGEAPPLWVGIGDVLLLSAQQSFVFASDPALPPVSAVGLFVDTGTGSKSARVGNGEDCAVIGGHVRLDPVNGGLLANLLPPLIHVRAAAPEATVSQWLLDQLVREQAGALPGANLASAQLAQLLFLQVLRVYLATSEPLMAGLLRALGDAKIAPALRLMHSDPARPWQLAELAKAAAMSRTTFAVYFKAVAGVAPLTYLLNWRMRLAERALRDADTPISVIADSLGYTSDSAFSNTFKRTMGMAPKRYRNTFRKGLNPALTPIAGLSLTEAHH